MIRPLYQTASVLTGFTPTLGPYITAGLLLIRAQRCRLDFSTWEGGREGGLWAQRWAAQSRAGGGRSSRKQLLFSADARALIKWRRSLPHRGRREVSGVLWLRFSPAGRHPATRVCIWAVFFFKEEKCVNVQTWHRRLPLPPSLCWAVTLLSWAKPLRWPYNRAALGTLLFLSTFVESSSCQQFKNAFRCLVLVMGVFFN